jgi:hypothetical protein
MQRTVAQAKYSFVARHDSLDRMYFGLMHTSVKESAFRFLTVPLGRRCMQYCVTLSILEPNPVQSAELLS